MIECKMGSNRNVLTQRKKQDLSLIKESSEASAWDVAEDESILRWDRGWHQGQREADSRQS